MLQVPEHIEFHSPLINISVEVRGERALLSSCSSFHFYVIINSFDTTSIMSTTPSQTPMDKAKVDDDSSLSTNQSSLTKSTKATTDEDEVTEVDEGGKVVAGGKRPPYTSGVDDGSSKKAKTEVVGVDEFGLPKSVRHRRIQGQFKTAAVFIHFRELSKQYSKTYEFDDIPCANNDGDSTKKQTTLFSKPVDNKTFNNICLFCLRQAISEPDAPEDAWKAALCNVKKGSSNAEKHLRTKHPNEPEVIQYFVNKENKKEEKKTMGLSSPTGLLKEFAKFSTSRLDLLREKMIDWLIACGVPHEATQTDEFVAMFKIFDQKAKPPSRETYIEGLDKRFDEVRIFCVLNFIQDLFSPNCFSFQLYNSLSNR